MSSNLIKTEKILIKIDLYNKFKQLCIVNSNCDINWYLKLDATYKNKLL